MRPNLKKPLIVFDLETTGLDLVKSRIIQIAYVKVQPDGTEKTCDYLVNPEIPIPYEATAITGITNEMVADAPTFKSLASTLEKEFSGCDFAGFNSNHFDIPLLAEEFLRAGIDFDFSRCRLIDIQTIFHKMEPRNLAAAFKFYCGKEMTAENVDCDGKPHQAKFDTVATYRVLQGQLDMYSPERQESEDKQLPNDMDVLAAFSRTNENVDFAGRIVWKPVLDEKGKPVLDEKGAPKKQEVFNFGKYKGRPVAEVLQQDTGYYGWMLNGDFTYNTKQVLTRIRLRNLEQR
ncbi:MAG: 3'-5' exonuclease [Prevotella sp.]|nr:3'-5' exonuclease [Prevotella sp.]